jgi:hypothetical protein
MVNAADLARRRMQARVRHRLDRNTRGIRVDVAPVLADLCNDMVALKTSGTYK